MPRSNNQSKPNGHAGTHGRANGHAPASTEGGGILERRDHAASDDASGAAVAMAANASVAASTDRSAYAEVAPPHSNGAANGSANASTAKAGAKEADEDKISPGNAPLPDHPGDFVEEIHRRIDLFKVWQKLLRSKDVKIKQRAVEKLTEMRYKGAAAMAEEPQRIVIDMPRPERD